MMTNQSAMPRVNPADFTQLKQVKINGNQPAMMKSGIRIGVGPKILIPRRIVALADLVMAFEKSCNTHLDSMFICHLYPVMYLFYALQPFNGFKSWMMHRWMLSINENTRFFEMPTKELRCLRINPATRNRYKKLLDSGNISDVLSGKNKERVSRNVMYNQFQLWLRVPYKEFTTPTHLWGRFLKDVFPDLYRAFYMDRAAANDYANTDVLPWSVFAHRKNNPESIMVILRVRDIYYALRDLARIADYSGAVAERVKRRGKSHLPLDMLIKHISDMLGKTCSQKLSDTWGRYRHEVEKRPPGASVFATGLPEPGINRVCQTAI